MPLIKLQFKPGVNRDQTNYSGEGGWYACDKIRFRSGYPEKIGGWVKYTPIGFYGVCRQMWGWITTFSDNFIALGTNNKLYIEAGGYLNDITPLRTATPTLSNPNTNNCVQTAITSTTVTVNLGTTHGATTGSFVTIAGVTGTIGGVPDSEINANHVITVIDTDSFSFVVSTAATSTVASGGGVAITISFEIAPGYASNTASYGWGTGTWGRASWGLGSTTAVYFPQCDWFLDNFDNDLVANIRGGAPYYWARGTASDPGISLATRAVTLQAYATSEGFDPNAVPAQVTQLMVSQQDKHLVAFGAVPFGSTSTADFDPLLIRWADQDSPGDWTPSAATSAGFIRVSRGSRILRAVPTRQETLIWTDTHLYTLQFTGTTDVFALQEYADNISLLSPRGVASAASITYWMGKDKFYAYTGRVETLACTLRNHVFQNLNYDQSAQIICGTNEHWNEIWWFYPSENSNWNDSYVVYNYLEKLWYYGSMERTAWLDASLRQWPLAADTGEGANTEPSTQGYLYNHENGINDGTSAMAAYIQSNDFDIADGEQFMLCRRILPDVGFNESTAAEPEVTLTMYARNFPGTAYQVDAGDSQVVTETSVGVYTEQVFIRARARQMAFKLSSADLGVQWQMGASRLDAREDGKR